MFPPMVIVSDKERRQNFHPIKKSVLKRIFYLNLQIVWQFIPINNTSIATEKEPA